MQTITQTDKLGQLNISSDTAVSRITALWALSESILGGILHATHIPFRGLIIASASVLFISIIFCYSKSPSQILKAGLLVILVKLTISPHTPVMAFFAVAYQSILGYTFFRFIHSYKVAAVFLSVIALSITGFQKIITLSIIFGFKLWDVVDDFAMNLLNLTGIVNQDSESVSLSLVIISFYILIHLTAGIFIGIISAKFPGWITDQDSDRIYSDYQLHQKAYINLKNTLKSTKGSKQKYIKYGITLFILLLLVLTFLFDQTLNKVMQSIILMSIRAILVLFIWFKIISPFITKLLLKTLSTTKWKRAEQVEQIISLFPHLNGILHYCWQYTLCFKNKRTRFKKFLVYTFLLLLSSSNE
ncbi:MAG TPA: hypothetical protein VI362_02435 [Ignavibacteriaceae bacterium]|nr:hypothetical protein [Ignavibacteriaceae bacterium]